MRGQEYSGILNKVIKGRLVFSAQLHSRNTSSCCLQSLHGARDYDRCTLIPVRTTLKQSTGFLIGFRVSVFVFVFRGLCFEIKLESRYFFGKQIFESELFRIGCSSDEPASKNLTEANCLAIVNIFTEGVLRVKSIGPSV